MSCIAVSNQFTREFLHSTALKKKLKPKILVVDDSLINQKIIAKMLLMLGYEADVASNGQEALCMYQNGYDAIILDYELPDMTGRDICTVIRENEKDSNSKLPIIMATTHQDEFTKKECLLAGANQFVNKPIPIELLSETLKSLVI